MASLAVVAGAVACRATDATDSGSIRPAANVYALSGLTGTILLQDDFSAPFLDTLKWRTFTDIPQGNAEVLVDGGHAVLINRGYLTTADEFSPSTLNGIRITGEWRFGGAGDDFIQIITRTNGFPNPHDPFGEVTHGIEFLALAAGVFEDPNQVAISGRGRAQGKVTQLSSTGSVNLIPGRTYRFEVVDQGEQASFTLTDTSDPSQSRTVVATSKYPGDFHHVAFHNREQCCAGDHRARLDNIVIEGGIN